MPIRRLIPALAVTVTLAACAVARDNPMERHRRCGTELASGTLTSDWLAPRAFIDLAEDQRWRGCYPVTLVAVQGPEGMLYRAAFKPRPDNIVKWHYEIGIAPGQARAMDEALLAAGYSLVWTDTSVDAGGNSLIQIVWVMTLRSSATP